VRACRSAAQDRVIQERGLNELVQAAKSAGEKNSRATEILLGRLSELQPSAVPGELGPKIGELRKQESVADALTAATKLQAAGDLQGAARELARALASYPDESRLKTMQSAVEIQQEQEKERGERARQEKEAFVKDVLQRAQNEAGLEGRIRILEHAVRKEPGEMRLQRPLNEARDLAEVSSSLASEARRLEQGQSYDQSLAKWQALREAYPKYPDLEKPVEETRGKQRQALLEAKGKAVGEVQSALGVCNYEKAERLLAQAKRDFAGDREVAAIEGQLRDGVARRADAQKLLAAGMKSVGMAQWQKGAESFKQAKERANADPVIGDQVLRALVQASEAALKSDLNAAEMLLGEAVRVQPGSQLLGPLKSKVQDHKRERMIEESSNAAARASNAGDFAGALQELGRVLAKYPDEPTLLRQRDEIQKQARNVEEEQGRVREQAAESGAAKDKPGEQFETELFDPESPFAQARIVRGGPAAQESLSPPLPEISRVAPPPEVARDPIKTDTPAIHAVPSETEFMAAGATLAEDETMLRVIEGELAVYVGPMARIMVKRAAAKATDTDELYQMLAKSLERDKDRAAFMVRKTELMKSRTKVPVPQPEPAGPLTSAVNPVSPLGITPEAIDHAARMLAAHVGPISGVLAKKAARKADSLQSLYRLLSEHLQNSKDRRQFLRDAGFPDG
jgi:hypothetical protein